MTPFRAALTNLAALSVPGVTASYAVDTVPDALSRAQLPALLVLPGEIQDRALFRERGQGFLALAFAQSARTVSVSVNHLLLTAPLSAGRGLRSGLPALVDLIDAYLAALAADVTLGSALIEPARVSIEPGTFTHGDVEYHGCAFRHTWLIEI